ncbi:MAG: transposase family protein, partial [Nitrospira sp.]|nr:transposase family protein [Nitrospira sp.]
LVHHRTRTPRSRAQRLRRRTAQSNHRWAMDGTHIPCGRDSWGHLTAVIDCHDREMVGYEFALRGRAKEAERALEVACLARFGTLRPIGSTPGLRGDNGLIFQSRRFRRACGDDRLQQEFMTPYTPEQNGLIERFFRSLKEACVCNTTLPDLRTRSGRLQGGCTGITRGGPSRPYSTEARGNIISTGTSCQGGLTSGEHYKRTYGNLLEVVHPLRDGYSESGTSTCNGVLLTGED